MARWQDVVDSAPEFAQAVRERFDAHKHKTLATLRRDGSPRISGIEATFSDGDLWIGSMPGAVKARDLQRDGRFALHTASMDPPEENPAAWTGDAKVAGTAIAVRDPQERTRAGAATGGGADNPVFRLELEEVVLTRVADSGDHLRIELWRPDRELQVFKRA